MNILYVAPRYHTNQIDIVNGWLNHGDEVVFISYYTSIIEDYDVLEPRVLGFSPIFKLLDRIYLTVKAGDIYAGRFKLKCGFPPIMKYRRLVKEYKPDVIIFRERSLYTIVGYLISKKNSKCILYNQSPLWDDPKKSDILHQMVYKLTPKYRFTPCMGKEEPGKCIDTDSIYIPFVVEPKLKSNNRDYFKSNKINILFVGVFEPRKNHILLVDALNNIYDQISKDINLTIIGESSNDEQNKFLNVVKSHIDESRIKEKIEIVTNVSRKDIAIFYTRTDLFVIPSTREPASISQLEAMSYSVPAICSDTNGSAHYVINGYNGYQFEDNNQKDLEDKLLKILLDENAIRVMGRNAYNSIVENNSFGKYYEGICQIMNKL